MKAAGSVSPARKAAFSVLTAVEQGRSHCDELLRGKTVNALSRTDRHLATALVLGVLRWQIRLDHRIQFFLARPNAKLDAEVRVALRLGAFQILHMDRIPARAAIDESVELVKQAGHRFASGMVNAVLRKLSGAPALDLPEGNAAQLALSQGHPAWMVERWASEYGMEAARALVRHGQSQPPLAIRVAALGVEEELAAAGIGLVAGELLSDARIVVSGDLTASVAFCEGRLRVQDEGSQLVAEIASANLLQSEGNILDACAAPGGKTLILAERSPQASIVACETSEPRFEALRSRVAALAGRVECRLADVTALPQSDAARFDLVLSDVPCSGTGTLGRNPEIRHRLHAADLPRQAERQRAILQSALRAVRPGGRVVYSTCSLEPEENEQVVAAVIATARQVRIVSIDESIERLSQRGVLAATGAEKLRAARTSEGALRLLPGMFQTDGFFIAQLERVK